jgi:hypothetical protein
LLTLAFVAVTLLDPNGRRKGQKVGIIAKSDALLLTKFQAAKDTPGLAGRPSNISEWDFPTQPPRPDPTSEEIKRQWDEDGTLLTTTEGRWENVASHAQDWNQLVSLLYEKLIKLLKDEESKGGNEKAAEKSREKVATKMERHKSQSSFPVGATDDITACAEKVGFPAEMLSKEDETSIRQALKRAESLKEAAHLERIYVMVDVVAVDGSPGVLYEKAWPAHLVKLGRCGILVSRDEKDKNNNLKKLYEKTWFGAPITYKYYVKPLVKHANEEFLSDDELKENKYENHETKLTSLSVLKKQVSNAQFTGAHICCAFVVSMHVSSCLIMCQSMFDVQCAPFRPSRSCQRQQRRSRCSTSMASAP